jgi:hypothetical protein
VDKHLSENPAYALASSSPSEERVAPQAFQNGRYTSPHFASLQSTGTGLSSLHWPSAQHASSTALRCVRSARMPHCARVKVGSQQMATAPRIAPYVSRRP